MENSFLLIIQTSAFPDEATRQQLLACAREIHAIQSTGLSTLSATTYVLTGTGTLSLLSRLVEIAHRREFQTKALYLDAHANWIT